MNRCMRCVMLAALVLSLAACAPKIYGTVQLVDKNGQPIPVTKESPQGTVINMIATTGAVEQASHAVTVDAEGKYQSEKKKLSKGRYKVEASRIGYVTETQAVEVGGFGGKKVDFRLQKIAEGKRKTIEGAKSDEDKIINPGEVNIQPPTM